MSMSLNVKTDSVTICKCVFLPLLYHSSLLLQKRLLYFVYIVHALRFLKKKRLNAFNVQNHLNGHLT